MFLTTPYSLRSSLKMWPYSEVVEGFESKDLDGDGNVLLMRIPDSSGAFKISKTNPRLIIAREATDMFESQGPFYRIVPEGFFTCYDGFTQKLRGSKELDLNRQSPAQFNPKEYGSGPYPLFLPEGRMMAEAISSRKNIVGAQSHHTFGGFLLRSSGLVSDEDLPTFDLQIFKLLGELGEKCTGYKAHSIFHDFRYNPKEVTTGTWADWLYHHRGVFSFSPEIWNIAKQVNHEIKNPLDFYYSAERRTVMQGFLMVRTKSYAG